MGPEPQFAAPIAASPFAVYVGPDHILAHVNETWADLYPGAPPVGAPAREIFRGEMGRQFVEALDRARETREVQYTPCSEHGGRVVIVPLLRDGQLRGVATACRLARRVPFAESLQALPELPVRLAEAS